MMLEYKVRWDETVQRRRLGSKRVCEWTAPVPRFLRLLISRCSGRIWRYGDKCCNRRCVTRNCVGSFGEKATRVEMLASGRWNETHGLVVGSADRVTRSECTLKGKELEDHKVCFDTRWERRGGECRCMVRFGQDSYHM